MNAALPSPKVFTPRVLVFRAATSDGGVFPHGTVELRSGFCLPQHCGSSAQDACTSQTNFSKNPAGRGAFRPIVKSSVQRNKATTQATKRKHSCPHCDVTCSNQGQLRGHMRVHTGERPFRCTFQKCTRSFARNEELTRHKRIHSGHRPYACLVCGKSFGRKDHLNKHQRTHATWSTDVEPCCRQLLAT